MDILNDICRRAYKDRGKAFVEFRPNWDMLAPTQESLRDALHEIGRLKAELAILQGKYDAQAVSGQGKEIENQQMQSALSRVCVIDEASSRTCQRGTKGCTVSADHIGDAHEMVEAVDAK